MRHGCTVTVAAALIAGFGLTPAAVAACNPRNPTACTSGSQAKARAAAPLQLKRFMRLGPARRSVSAPDTRPAERNQSAAKTAAADAARLTPKAIATVAISAPALALTGENRTVGFAATTEHWSGASAFAATDDSAALPPGVTIARSDEFNAIDLAAEAGNAAPPAKADRLAGMSLVTPANAAPMPPMP